MKREMVRLLFDRVVTPGTAAAGYVLWYISYHASGGAATRSQDSASGEQR
jgi:hypothetical protein